RLSGEEIELTKKLNRLKTAIRRRVKNMEVHAEKARLLEAKMRAKSELLPQEPRRRLSTSRNEESDSPLAFHS
ncbi:MAG: hypothetical protein OK454_10970, partial [Thaumarchaeota archaeon]|nr:hypothetical protein [Nitrososphaerota archaeon]